MSPKFFQGVEFETRNDVPAGTLQMCVRIASVFKTRLLVKMTCSYVYWTVYHLDS